MRRKMQTLALVAAGSLGGSGLAFAPARAVAQQDQRQPSEEAAQGAADQADQAAQKAQEEAQRAQEEAAKAQQQAQEAQQRAQQEAQDQAQQSQQKAQEAQDQAQQEAQKSGQPKAGAGAQAGKSSGMTATGTVESVDTKNRKLTLSNEEGRTMTVNVPAGVTGLEDLKPGDKVSVQVEPTATSIQPTP